MLDAHDVLYVAGELDVVEFIGEELGLGLVTQVGAGLGGQVTQVGAGRGAGYADGTEGCTWQGMGLPYTRHVRMVVRMQRVKPGP